MTRAVNVGHYTGWNTLRLLTGGCGATAAWR